MIRQFRNIEKGEFLVAGYDMATGVKDYCAVVFISKQKADVPLVIHTDKIATEVTNTVVNVLEKIYDITEVKPLIAPETNSGGVYEIERMLAMNRLNKYEIWKQPQDIGLAVEREPIRYGWTTTSANRSKMLSDLKQAIDNRILRIYDEKIINELYSFVLVKSSSIWRAQAENNAHDDLIMALAIAYQLFISAEPPLSDNAIEQMLEELPKDNLFTKDGFY